MTPFSTTFFSEDNHLLLAWIFSGDLVCKWSERNIYTFSLSTVASVMVCDLVFSILRMEMVMKFGAAISAPGSTG